MRPAVAGPDPRVIQERETGRETGFSTLALTLLCLLIACATSLLIALANTPWFEFVNGIVGARESVARSLVFSSWLLLLGGPLVAWRPKTFGFTLGETRRHWRLIGATLIVAAGLTALLLAATGQNPYSDASAFVEVGLVPFTEELVFRGVLLTALLLALGRLHDPRRALILAVAFDGLAFGVAHAANATSLGLSFVLSQVAFASVLGTACAWLMAKTRSVYPAMVLHGVVNAVVVAF
jgi:membrane protease YdiL (CAAX protease family)